MRIELAGALSCGKSTLADYLSALGLKVVREDLSTNPYLDLRVQDPEKYDFPCQRQFVLDKIASLEAAEVSAAPYACDFSIAAERAYVTHYAAGRQQWIDPLFALLEQCEKSLGQPDLVVHLRCAPEEQLNRIRTRGRDFEQGHDLAFVSRISDLVDLHVKDLRAIAGVNVVEYWTDRQRWSEILDDLCTHYLPRLGFRPGIAA
jgi:deoxyadenosine/deoxycytidine kinase